MIFESLTLAALAALADSEALTPSYEAGTGIYACGQTYRYTPPITSNSRTGVDIVTYRMPGCVLVALVHTHPTGDARFSEADVRGACKLGVPVIMKPRGGIPRVCDCAGIPASALQDTSRHAFRTLAHGKEL
jgi:hypothetical protein